MVVWIYYPPEPKGIPKGLGLVIVNNISQATMLYVTARFQISHPIAPCCDHSSSIGDYCTHKVSKTSSTEMQCEYQIYTVCCFLDILSPQSMGEDFTGEHQGFGVVSHASYQRHSNIHEAFP